MSVRRLLLAASLAVAIPAGLLAQTGPVPDHPVDELMARLVDADVAWNARTTALPDRATVTTGRLIAMGGYAGGAQAPCFACHGQDGAGNDAGAIPMLAALPAAYVQRRLDQYATGAHENAVMTPIAAALDEEQRRAVAVYYSLLPPAYGAAPDAAPDVLQHGSLLNAQGSVAGALPACSNCHGPYGTGIPPEVPPLAGQSSTYIVAQLEVWISGERPAEPTNPMLQVARSMSDEDRKAAAAYFAGLRPPEDIAIPLAEVRDGGQLSTSHE
jgi:cytochrome c553